MLGYGVLMLIFGVLLMLAGIYIYSGHNSEVLLWKGYNKHTTKKELKNIGKYVITVSISLMISGISGLFFQDDSLIPIIILFISLLLSLIIAKIIN